MAQFRATIVGQRGEASRLGNKMSGLRCECNGWTAGVTVYAEHRDGKDVFTVWRTTGSAARGGQVLLAEFDGDSPLPNR